MRPSGIFDWYAEADAAARFVADRLPPDAHRGAWFWQDPNVVFLFGKQAWFNAAVEAGEYGVEVAELERRLANANLRILASAMTTRFDTGPEAASATTSWAILLWTEDRSLCHEIAWDARAVARQRPAPQDATLIHRKGLERLAAMMVGFHKKNAERAACEAIGYPRASLKLFPAGTPARAADHHPELSLVG